MKWVVCSSWKLQAYWAGCVGMLYMEQMCLESRHAHSQSCVLCVTCFVAERKESGWLWCPKSLPDLTSKSRTGWGVTQRFWEIIPKSYCGKKKGSIERSEIGRGESERLSIAKSKSSGVLSGFCQYVCNVWWERRMVEVKSVKEWKLMN